MLRVLGILIQDYQFSNKIWTFSNSRELLPSNILRISPILVIVTKILTFFNTLVKTLSFLDFDHCERAFTVTKVLNLFHTPTKI